jgi:hypothetical protein
MLMQTGTGLANRFRILPIFAAYTLFVVDDAASHWERFAKIPIDRISPLVSMVSIDENV